MQAILSFLSMGGYAEFVWPAFAVSAALMAGLWLVSRKAWRESQSSLEALQATRPERPRAARGKGELDS